MVAHFAFVAWVLLGGVLSLRFGRLVRWHLPFFAYAVVIEAVRFSCPLTDLEKFLRVMAELPVYEGGFLGHYVEPRLRAAGLPAVVFRHMGYWTVGLNLAVYVVLFRRWRSSRGAIKASEGVPADGPR